jgi:ribosomal protein L22
LADEKKKKAKKPAAKKAESKKPAAKAEGKKAAGEKAEGKKARAKKADGAKATARKAEAGKAPAKKRSRRKAAEKTEPKAEPRKPAPKPVPIMVRASSRYVRVAPRKARLVADQIRGLHIDQARALLEFSPRGAAKDIRKLIDSAASNAENNHDLVADEMRVAEITVDEGPTLRRYRPRALGRATPINKRTSHIGVALSPDEEA